MKYVITGSLGHISRAVVEQLVKGGHSVKVISTSETRSKDIKALGAEPLTGSVEDVEFLRKAFAGADAVYTMVPPTFSAADWKKHIATIGENYAAALKGSTVRFVVNLSSVGAHLEEGCGPVSGLHGAESALNGLEGIHVLHVRPAFFYYNFFANIGMIKHMGFIGGNYGKSTRIQMVHTDDIARVVSEALLKCDFSGKSYVYVISDERTTDEIASVLGAAVGKPDLGWVDFTDEQSTAGMVQAGLPHEVAKNYTEMGAAMRSGIMFEDVNAANTRRGSISLDTFAREFAQAFKNQ